MGKRLRRPGSPWRLLAHHYTGKQPDGTMYDVSHHVSNQPSSRPDGEYFRGHVLEGTEFDELVVGSWIHVEQMSSSVYWMEIGGVVVNVTVDRDGRPKAVDVYGPDDYSSAVEGVKYNLTWSRDE